MPDTTKELPESIEVIEEEIEQTRTGLADKLEALTQKLSGTVEEVGETVETVVETTKETIHNIQETFNIPKQVEEHPWLAMGASVLVGFVGGKLLGSLTSRGNGHAGYASNGMAESVPQRMASASEYAPQPPQYEAPYEEESHSQSRSWLAELGQHFAPEINKAKGLALGTMFGVIRDMVSQALPETLKNQVATVFDNVTEKVGGEPIQQGSLVKDSSDESSSAQGSTAGSSRRNPSSQPTL
jgi:ElaB/YqjD/DUF883 family membrane-anchored ribosome-binding protein